MDELKSKSLKGVLGLSVVLGLLIFLPVWRLNYWQGWLYLGLFSGSTLFITIYLLAYDRPLLERRMQAGPTAEAEKSQQLIQSMAGLLVTGLVVVSCLDYRFGWSQVPAIMSIVAGLIVVAGFYIVFRVFQANSYTAAIIKVAENQTLTTTGPYAIVRHPMYTGALLLFIATPISLGSYWGLVVSCLLVVILAVRTLDEERILTRDLAGYSAYCARTKYRFIPLIW